MTDLQEVFDMVTNQTEPDQDSWKQQEQRQRRTAQSRRIGAIATVAAIIAALVLVFAVTRPSGQGTGIGTGPSSPPPSVGLNTTLPIGAQIVGLDGTPIQQIPGLSTNASGLQLSPDGRTIAFITDGKVATIGTDGRLLRILTQDLNNNGDAQNAVSWSPDGRQIAYAASNDIYVMNADGSNVRRLTTDPGGDYYPAWSTDDVIAYWHGAASGVDGGPPDSEIYTIPAIGGTPTRLTHDGVSNIEPAWSPDGKRIAYWSGGELWVMRADGSGTHRVHSDGGVWAPAWSPDGTKIAYLKYVGNLHSSGAPIMDVRVLHLVTGKVTNLGEHVLTDANGPSWVSNDELLLNRWN